jgi:AraC-like DNA-binding protein
MGRLIDSGVLPPKRLIYRGEVMSVEEHQARNPDLSLMSDQITELQWQIEDVMQPSNMANKVQAMQFRSMIQPTLEARKGLTAATDAVLAFMDAGFHKQESVSLSAAAFSMNMEASTLRRRLAAEGTKFSYLLRDYRAKASVCLLMSGLAVKEVSQQLGYAEPSAFQHAFQQWYGLPPKRYLRARQSTKTRV